jgi:hypothetical protein
MGEERLLIRISPDVSQLVCLANLEAINAELIRQSIPQGKRLIMLNEIAITQMRSLLDNPSTRKLEGKGGSKTDD